MKTNTGNGFVWVIEMKTIAESWLFIGIFYTKKYADMYRRDRNLKFPTQKLRVVKYQRSGK